MSVPLQLDALRVGMFVHLNVGWMKHPFPLSSFKIASQDQIETIRGLGLAGLTWSPERSDPEASEPADVATAAAADAAAVAAAEAAAGTATAHPGDAADTADTADTADGAEARALDPAALDPRHAARQALAHQRELALRCERQFSEACRDLRRTADKVMTDPAQAHQDTHQLATALLDKLLIAGEPCLRVLGEMAADRNAAHALNVTIVSLMLARQIELPREQLLDLGVGALLHDIGKSALPDRVRQARDDFTSTEAALYRDHVAQGLVLGRRMGLAADAQLVIAQHHELADGTGFPSALMLARMALPARIVAMVNKYDNLCNGATPAQSLTPHEALSKMFAQCRSKYDEALLNAFIKLMGIYPPGSVVQLSDERFAMVMNVNANNPLKPRVLVFDPHVPADEALHLDLAHQPALGIRRSLRNAQVPPRAADYLKPRQRIAYYFDVEPARERQVPAEVAA